MLAVGGWQHADVRVESIPLTVVGGYLGAGKTTLVNHLLRHPDGRRIGVIVNDFGSLAIDAALLGAAGGDDLVSLPNGCVCCTVGAGLHDALTALTERAVDHVVVEVSGVADPAAAAAWGTVAPFEPAGVVVLADATSVQRQARDRYVGAEVRRQLGGADLVVMTKTDLCDGSRVAGVESWLDEVTGGAPSIRVVDGRVPTDVVLGVRPGRAPSPIGEHGHEDRYVSWSWTAREAVARDALDRCLASLDPSVLRVKGSVLLDDGSWVTVQVVGRRIEVAPGPPAPCSELVAIATRHEPPSPDPFVLHFG
jgi:G3E family GTPase